MEWGLLHKVDKLGSKPNCASDPIPLLPFNNEIQKYLHWCKRRQTPRHTVLGSTIVLFMGHCLSIVGSITSMVLITKTGTPHLQTLYPSILWMENHTKCNPPSCQIELNIRGKNSVTWIGPIF